ncbi:hypothetical protein HYFRA_00004771, partial [Hymenoscyphus fraxineus]
PIQSLHTTHTPPPPLRSPGPERPPIANIPPPQSLAAILSPSAPQEESTGSNSRASTPKRSHAEAFSPEPLPYLHPASPTQSQPRASIASLGAPSPSAREADDGSGGARGSLEEKKPAKMVRSSIACTKCRRSKVKCINEGTNSVCKACHLSGRECSYPTPGVATTPKRSEAPPGIKQEDGESKKRVRKLEDTGRRNSNRSVEDVLDSSILTRKVWDELFELFKLHFLTEMPFLHPPTFRNRMRQAAYPRDPSITYTNSEEVKLLLLGVLTLTARFHTELINHHSPTGDPIVASEVYYSALYAALHRDGNGTRASVEVIQAWLMMTLYEWGQLKDGGTTAWVHLAIPFRLAQSMELHYEDDAGPGSHAYPPPKEPRNRTPDQILTEKEVRRRTWWSLFIMDRMLSAGKRRIPMIPINEMRIQLPCSEDQFLFIKKVHTGHLQPDWDRPNLTVNDDGILGWYIRLVEIFGRFTRWSYAGGRRTETLPPWDPSSSFYRLRNDLEDFARALPSNLAFTKANLSAHIEKRNSTPYTLMHTLYCLCLIMLHREFIPFIPLRSNKPSGPIDAPTFPPDRFKTPEGFWETSAEIMLTAAKGMIDIVRICHDDNVLPESPQIAFAIWQAAFVCVYAKCFPQMDPKRIVGLEQGYDSTEIMSSAINAMVPRLEMAKRHQATFVIVQKIFAKAIKDSRSLGFSGGGGDHYKMLERPLKEFGGIGNLREEEGRSRASTTDIDVGANGEVMSTPDSTPRSHTAWAAINTQSPDCGAEEQRARFPPQPSAYPYSNGFPQPIAQNQARTPSLINGDSSSSLSSPHPSTQTPQYYAQPLPHQLINGTTTYAPVSQNAMVPMAPPHQYQAIPSGDIEDYLRMQWPPVDFEGNMEFMMNQQVSNYNPSIPVTAPAEYEQS